MFTGGIGAKTDFDSLLSNALFVPYVQVKSCVKNRDDDQQMAFHHSSFYDSFLWKVRAYLVQQSSMRIIKDNISFQSEENA